MVIGVTAVNDDGLCQTPFMSCSKYVSFSSLCTPHIGAASASHGCNFSIPPASCFLPQVFPDTSEWEVQGYSLNTHVCAALDIQREATPMRKPWLIGNGVSRRILLSPIHSVDDSEVHSTQLFRGSQWDGAPLHTVVTSSSLPWLSHFSCLSFRPAIPLP